ncbi:hypothetical protein HN51_011196 [Arachis hypogaea]
MSTLNLVNPNPYSMSFCWPLTPKRCSPASSLQPNMFYPWFKFAAAARVSCNSRLRPPSLLSSSPLPQSQGLRMLSLILRSEITDASVVAIASSYTNLELLDLSGYVSYLL